MSNTKNLADLAAALDDGTSGQVLQSTGSGGVQFADAAGGATKAITHQETFTTSGTFTAPYTGDYRFILIGGGGGGWSSNTGAGGLTLRGAGGGAVVVYDCSLSAGTSFSYTVGAGGDTPSGTDKNGVTGGTTSATINSQALSAGGGGAGLIQSSTGNAGGTASGGTLNFNGKTATGAAGATNGVNGEDFVVPVTYEDPNGEQFLSLTSYGDGGATSTSGNGGSTVDGQSGAFHYICYVGP